MGKRGPQPKPTALKVFEGNRLRNPSDRSAEPIPPTTPLPQPPEWLGVDGQAAWARMGPPLQAVGCLTDADLDLFAQWCEAHDTYHTARLDVLTNGIAFETEHGRQANPAVRIKFLATGIIIKLGTLFGMGPAARVGMSGAPQDPERDDLDNFKRGTA